MVPKITSPGRSFKGAHLYYGHDKKAASSERVLFFETLNLRSQDPDKAWKLMAWTAEHEENLKRQNGLKWNGEKTQKPVYAFSLAWDVDERPSPEEMRQAALSALACRRLQEHQAVLYGHNDTDHKHVHVLVNLIHPETGRCANTYKDRLELSRWAQSYEEQQGKIRCEQRVENNKRRENGQFVKHQDADIQKAWETSKTGAEFAAALEKSGYRLAQGNSRIVIVDPEGKTINPARKIQGVRSADIKEKLKGLELANAAELQKQSAGRPSKTQATTLAEEENKRIQDAEKRKERPEKELQGAFSKAETPLPAPKMPEIPTKAPQSAPKEPQSATEYPKVPEDSTKNQKSSFAESLDRIRAMEDSQQRRRDALEAKLKESYDRAGTERLLSQAKERAARSDNFIGRLTGKHRQALDDAAAYQKNLENIRQRIDEQKQALENRLKAERLVFEGEKREPPAPAPRYESARDMLDRFERSASPAPANDNGQGKEKQDKGQDKQRGTGRDQGGYER